MSTAKQYKTVAAAEEQHLAAMSSTTTSTTKSSKVKTTKKVSSKKISSAASSIEISDSKVIDNVIAGIKGQAQETLCAEESIISEETSITKSKEGVQKKSKIMKKKSTTAIETSVSVEQVEELQHQEQLLQHQEQRQQLKSKKVKEDEELDASNAEMTTAATTPTTPTTPTTTTNGKKKTKKSKKSDAEKENISVKSSFSKFDALQKKNLIHVRSSDAGKAQEKFSNPQAEQDKNCRLCTKPVYKMEEIKAEKHIYHKNCFRCQECSKQLKVENFKSHEGVLYCEMHFKLLFAPKVVEDTEPKKPRKAELIIRENQPDELPPDVVRASDKPDLGLEELQQLNLRSKFQVFENGQQKLEQQQSIERSSSNIGVKRSTSILSKMAKLQARGFTTGLSVEQIEHEDNENDDDSCASSGTESEGSGSDDDGDRDLVRSKKRTQRERPVGLGNAMNDIKTKFEKGHNMSKEERREERKQEIQSIRSRLFMGKQARIKEMYQQAVADSEQAITSVGKKPEIDIGDKARNLKQRFETGEMFKDRHGSDNEMENENGGRSAGVDDADVFESAISKKSRSIFMELDANATGSKPLPRQAQGIQRNRSMVSNRFSESEQENSSTFQQQENVIKHDEKAEDIQVATSEISSKFKFFETYQPTERQKKQFRITPPRDGVVKLPTPDSETEFDADGKPKKKLIDTDAEIIEKTHTASVMLNKFREMEQRKNNSDAGPRPLKCFTPPPDGGRRLYQDHESDGGSEEYEEEDEEEGEDEEYEEEDEQQFRQSHMHLEDEALREAQAAARAKQLRAKFEKWEANEIQRELNEGRVNIYSEEVSDDTNIESTKSIRERFENMKNLEKKSPTRPRYQVNRFV